jgi:hypothetical protein
MKCLALCEILFVIFLFSALKGQWDASGYASGIYYYRLSTDAGYVETNKLVLLR